MSQNEITHTIDLPPGVEIENVGRIIVNGKTFYASPNIVNISNHYHGDAISISKPSSYQIVKKMREVAGIKKDDVQTQTESFEKPPAAD